MVPPKMYIPNHEKWIKYYENMSKSEHPESRFVHGKRFHKSQTGGSIGKSVGAFMIPIEKKRAPRDKKDEDIKVNLVSPAQQVVEQAESELQREHTKPAKRKNNPEPKGKRVKRARKLSGITNRDGRNQF